MKQPDRLIKHFSSISFILIQTKLRNTDVFLKAVCCLFIDSDFQSLCSSFTPAHIYSSDL